MSKSSIGKKIVFATAIAGVGYAVATGKGPFNKFRFKKQRLEMDKYVAENHPGCIYTNISMHGKGWASTIMSAGEIVSYVYFIKSEDGSYIFTELDEKIKI